MRIRAQQAKSRQYKSTLVEMERRHETAIESEAYVSATPSSSPLLLPLPPHLPPPQARPPVVRLQTSEIQQAAESCPLPSPQLAASPSAAESPSTLDPVSPASPVVYCSQYRMEEYERQNGPLPGNEKVGEWLHNVQTAYSSDGPAAVLPLNAEPSLNPTLPAAPRKDQYVSDSESEHGRHSRPRRRSPPAMLFKDGQLLVHKDHKGRIPLCYYSTGLQGGGPHDVYACFDKRDIVWARRIRFHNERARD